MILGLSSLATDCRIPPTLAGTVFLNLRHLEIDPDHFPARLPAFPSLTHLTLAHAPPRPLDFAAAFPAVTYLKVQDLETGHRRPAQAAFLRALPASVAHFATDDVLTDEVCRGLPDELGHVSVTAHGQKDLGSIWARWCAPADGSGAEPSGSCRLGGLTLLMFPGQSVGRYWAAQVRPIRRAGCKVLVKLVKSLSY